MDKIIKDCGCTNVEKQLLNLIHQHGSIILRKCGAGIFIENGNDNKAVGNIIDNSVRARFVEMAHE